MSSEACNPVTLRLDTDSANFAWYLKQEVSNRPTLRAPLVIEDPYSGIVLRKLPPRSITYEPKIGPVIRGECGQTIREFNEDLDDRYRVRVGDMITFHGWQGKPYHSAWSRWRLHVEISSVELLVIDRPDGFTIHRPGATFTGKWNGILADYLARLDCIAPATGLELKRVLERLNRGSIQGKVFQILRWDPEEAYLETHNEHPEGDQ